MYIALYDENSSYVTFPERKKNCILPRSSKRMNNFFPALSKNVNDDLLGKCHELHEKWSLWQELFEGIDQNHRNCNPA